MIDQIPQTVQQPQNWMQLVYLGLIVILANIPIWIRELKKAKDFKAKNGTLKDIKDTITKVDGKVDKTMMEHGKTQKQVAGITANCKAVSTALTKHTSDNAKQILDLWKTQGKGGS